MLCFIRLYTGRIQFFLVRILIIQVTKEGLTVTCGIPVSDRYAVTTVFLFFIRILKIFKRTDFFKKLFFFIFFCP